MASRQAAVLARRGAARIASSSSTSSSSVRTGSVCVSSSARSISQAAAKAGILGTERGFATVVVMIRSVGFAEVFAGSSLRNPSAANFKTYPRIQISPFHATSRVDAVQEIGMPSLSPTMTQGNIAKWRKKEGEKVSAGDILCEIETDKATLEMESMEDGFLGKILVGDGVKDIPCGQVICVMVESEDELKTIADYKPTSGGSPPAPKAPSPPLTVTAPPPSPPKESPKPAASKPSAPPPSRPTGDRVFASPAARKLAEDKNVSLSSIKGTGPEGSIVKADVEEYLATGPSPSHKQTKQGAGGALAADVDYRDIPNTQIRKITAKRLLQSKQTIPHYYLSLDTRVDKLLRLRADLNRNLEASQKKGGPVRKVSLNDFVIKAAALALKKVPEVNSSWTEEYIRQYHNVNISVAVQTEHGLMVPVVKDADKKGLATISDDIKALAGKARSNTLRPNDYEGGTFTVSNLGSFGVKQFCAIVNPPQACILAVGTTEKRVCPGAESGDYEPGNFMTVTLSCDHRVIDGAVGAQWLGAFKGYIEDPVTLML